MLQRIRTVLAIIEEGSINRAARRLGVAQPTLSRHIQSLEQELGAPLFEREASGMRPTGFGFFIRDKFVPIVREYDFARAEALAFAQGRHRQLRVGYIGLAASRWLNPALTMLRKEFRDLKLLLFDQTPAEQLLSLREGRIDVALVGQEGAAQAEDFFRRSAGCLGVRVALPADHPLAGSETLALRKLKGENFVGVAESAVPGRNAWISRLCAKAGFRVRFLAQTDAITETFALVAGEGAVALLPDYLTGPPPPGVAYATLADPWAVWTLWVLRQRGRGSPPASRLVDLICSGAAGQSTGSSKARDLSPP